MKNKFFSLTLCVLICAHSSFLPAFASTIFPKISEDGGGNGKGFIVPNEDEYYLFHPSIAHKTGALISVGTFRAFQDASIGNFSHVILLDYASEVVRFNRQFVELIQTSTNRIDFLTRLARHESARKIFENLESEKISSVSYWHQMRDLLRAHPQSHPPRLPSDALVNRMFVEQMDAFEFSTTLLLDFYPRQKPGFLTQDHAFEKLQKLVSENRISVIHGNLAGVITLQDIARFLRQSDVSVSILDISNAFPYIYEARQESYFFENLLHLPFSQDAQVLFTSHDIKKAASLGGGWNYYAVPAPLFIQGASIFSFGHTPIGRSWPYQVFIETLTPLSESTSCLSLLTPSP